MTIKSNQPHNITKVTKKAKKKKISFEPDSNQRPKDINQCLYSPPLYQLSYRRGEYLK